MREEVRFDHFKEFGCKMYTPSSSDLRYKMVVQVPACTAVSVSCTVVSVSSTAVSTACTAVSAGVHCSRCRRALQ